MKSFLCHPRKSPILYRYNQNTVEFYEEFYVVLPQRTLTLGERVVKTMPLEEFKALQERRIQEAISLI